jgi:CRP-like cAMP-binding protein
MITPEEMKAIEFLRHLSEQHLNQIARMANLKECETGTIVFREGQDSPFLYFVLSGNVGLEMEGPDGTSVEVSRLGPGDLLGWSPVLGRHALTATARAVARTRLASLNVQELLQLCDRDPQLGVAFLWQIAQVLSERVWGIRRNLARALSHRPLLTPFLEGSD